MLRREARIMFWKLMGKDVKRVPWFMDHPRFLLQHYATSIWWFAELSRYARTHSTLVARQGDRSLHPFLGERRDLKVGDWHVRGAAGREYFLGVPRTMWRTTVNDPRQDVIFSGREFVARDGLIAACVMEIKGCLPAVVNSRERITPWSVFSGPEWRRRRGVEKAAATSSQHAFI